MILIKDRGLLDEQLRQTNKTKYKHTHMLWDSDLPIQEYSDTHVYTTIYDQGSFKPVARLVWLRMQYQGTKIIKCEPFNHCNVFMYCYHKIQ